MSKHVLTLRVEAPSKRARQRLAGKIRDLLVYELPGRDQVRTIKPRRFTRAERAEATAKFDPSKALGVGGRK